MPSTVVRYQAGERCDYTPEDCCIIIFATEMNADSLHHNDCDCCYCLEANDRQVVRCPDCHSCRTGCCYSRYCDGCGPHHNDDAGEHVCDGCGEYESECAC